MKKIMIFAAFAAALLTVSCNKEARLNDAPEQPALRTVTFNALPTETKTAFGDKTGTKYPVLWQEGDKINYTFNFGDIPSTYLEASPSADGTSASFSGKFAESSSYQFIFVSPAEAFKSRNKTEGTIMVEFPSGQTSTAASPDPSAQILYANTGVLTELPDPLDVRFSHLSAYLHLQFTNVALGDAVVQAVNVTSADYNIAGRLFYKFNEDIFTEGTSSLFHTIAVATSTISDVWVALRPVDLSGKQLVVSIATDKGTFTKTVMMPASANLTRGKIGKFPVDMTGVALEEPVVYKVVTSADQLHVGDKVIIAAADIEQEVAMSTGQNGNNRSQAGVTKTAEEIVNPSDAVEIIRLEDGFIPGHYALKATSVANPGYLYAASLDVAANWLRTSQTLDISGSWTISIEDVTIDGTTTEKAAVIVSDAPAPASNVIRHNPGSVLFSAYQSTSKQKAVKLYRLDEPADESLRFNAILPGGNSINASAQEIPVYVYGNVAWTASVTGDAILDKSSGTGNDILTLTVPANADSDNTKSYVITVSTEADVSPNTITLQLTQDKYTTPSVTLSHWSFSAPGDNWKQGTDYSVGSVTGAYIYSDDHSGKLSVVIDANVAQPTTASKYNTSNFTGYGIRQYGVQKDCYWLFEVYDVQQPAGEYTIDFNIASSASGPKFFIMEYSLDGTSWTSFNTTTEQFYYSANNTDYGDPMDITYTFWNHSSYGFETVNQKFSLPAITTATTLRIRAIVSADYRASKNGSIDKGGVNILGNHIDISFKAK
ncbi:MAG: BACON domain-containing protein [Bacteroidales bacterium]|nr:BACON domain-containing protein [Bacteroidales bacterium]